MGSAYQSGSSHMMGHHSLTAQCHLWTHSSSHLWENSHHCSSTFPSCHVKSTSLLFLFVCCRDSWGFKLQGSFLQDSPLRHDPFAPLLDCTWSSCSLKVTLWFKFLGFIYIYAFSRRFYPKQLTVHSGYTFFVSMCVPWELNPQPLRC